MRSGILGGLVVLAVWAPNGVAALQSADSAAVGSVTAPPAAYTPDVLQANVLRAQAISVLDRRGPADLALAQLTRAALLDPKTAETWRALERGAAQIEISPPSTESRWAAFKAELVGRLQAIRVGATEGALGLRAATGQFWVTHRGNPRSWAGFLFVLLASGTVCWLVLRSKAQARAAKERRAAELTATAAATPTSRKSVQANTPSADELALRAYLEGRTTNSDGTAEAGILARA